MVQLVVGQRHRQLDARSHPRQISDDLELLDLTASVDLHRPAARGLLELALAERGTTGCEEHHVIGHQIENVIDAARARRLEPAIQQLPYLAFVVVYHRRTPTRQGRSSTVAVVIEFRNS